MLRSAIQRAAVRGLRTGMWRAAGMAGAGGAVGGTAYLLKSAMAEERIVPTQDSSEQEDIYSLDEVSKHNTEESAWVTWKDGVYDVTQYVKYHPGGRDLLLASAGQGLEAPWSDYRIHELNGKAVPMLESMRIGALAEGDQERAVARGKEYTARDARFREIAQARSRRVWLYTATMPLLYAVRWMIRVAAIFLPSFAEWMANRAGMSIPGHGKAGVLSVEESGQRTRVAVIGAGVGGCGAAWTLTESGYDVTVYEGRPTLGGNAQTYDFGGQRLDGLVSYFNHEYYANYLAVLDKLGIGFDTVWLPHVVHSTLRGYSSYFTCVQGPDFEMPQPSMNEEFAEDLHKFDRAVGIARFFERMCYPYDADPSFYKYSIIMLFNPMNYISIKQMCKMMGISQEFWENVMVPYDGFQHFGIEEQALENVPAATMPILEDIAPMVRPRTSLTWKSSGNSAEVFDKMTAKANVKLNTRVVKVEEEANGRIRVIDDSLKAEEYDRVIFACPATAVANALEPSLSTLESDLLRGVQYKDDLDRLWVRGFAHQDTTVFPEPVRQNMDKNCAFWIDISPGENGKPHFELTQNAGVISGQHTPNCPTALMSFNRRESQPYDPDKVIQEVCISRSHPILCAQNLILAQLIPLIQGRRGMYFCSNYSTCGNGHDLSLLSGIICATAIGADYPFPNDTRAVRDYERLADAMGLAKPPSKAMDLTKLGVLLAGLSAAGSKAMPVPLA